MEAGRELDALVAEKVMGWTVLHQHPNPRNLITFVNIATGDIVHRSEGPWYYPPGYPPLDNGVYVPDYSTDIAAAWQVVEQLLSDGHHVEIECIPDYQCECYIDNQPAKDGYSGYAPTAPLAICLAALKAVGVEADI